MSSNASNSSNKPFFLYKLGTKVPCNVTHVCVDSSVLVLPRKAFKRRHQLKEVVLPEGLTCIDRDVFSDCHLLEHVNFPSTLTAIGAYAFHNTSLRVVELCKGIQTIGRSAFAKCESLERIHFPSTLTFIGTCAFEGCTSLTDVKLCGGILDIGYDAFADCKSLERIAIPSKAFVTVFSRNCRLLTDGTISPSNFARLMVMIAPECLESMSLAGLLAEAENAINAVTSSLDETRWEDLEQIRALFANYDKRMQSSNAFM